VLAKVRGFDPAGVAAFDLPDCLLLQLDRRGEGNSTAARILRHHLSQLARHRFEEIAREIRVPLAEVSAAVRLISSLEPKPGRPFAETPEQGVIPDLIVIPEGDGFIVRINEEELPRLKINQEYKDLLASREGDENYSSILGKRFAGLGSFCAVSSSANRHCLLSAIRL